MEILVTGASGVLGSQVTSIALERGHTVRRLSRRERDGWWTGDIASGAGMDEAAGGVEAIVHCASNPRKHKSTDVNGTRRLIAAARAAGNVHIVFPGIVGSDVIPLGYYRSKTLAEEALEESGLPITIQRFTQFHELLWTVLSMLTRSPLTVVPNDTRFQVLDSAVAARQLMDTVERGPSGRLPDLGGPTAYDVRDLARSVATALGRKRKVVRLNAPGLVGAAFRAGGNLTPNRDEYGATWNDFVARRLNEEEHT